ncbi:hypothetical protein KB221_13170 [Aquidulcibacter paucihalophilus]|jgi:hypothetical protein|nr:hypothetical protein KB221_13170 [Aquidulcibacter paucihalophilus]
MRRALPYIVFLALASCGEQPEADAQPSTRMDAVDASSDELEGLVRLDSLDAASSLSLANDTRLVAYASPHGEGVAWVMPGLRCPKEAFAAAKKVEIGAAFPESATLAGALFAHNRRVAKNPDNAGDCVNSPGP